MGKPRLLDLFCGAGGAAAGYARAGFDVVGVDNAPQPNYPFRFIQEDAMRFMDMGQFQGFDAIHASPPCQPHVKGMRAVNAALGREMKHADLLAPTRARLIASGVPYILENVVGAAMSSIVLCGSSFGLKVRRHRQFESNVLLFSNPCYHFTQREKKYWTSTRKKGEQKRASVVQVYGNGGEHHEWPAAMGIDWMKTDHELREAIPPAYTEFLGRQLLAAIEQAA